ncbi:unnamed protein product [Musa acuminata subsp. burmannicoides]|uniref:(wild Malaysian banana) hypothetical protein n=1 Tax=Musa acuminata subsp. malaccensis TaxID=214687 RepID=A0A804KLZ9_MUSAM|nr:unnamed protein product [Musa acuminata subsp. malaccensis]
MDHSSTALCTFSSPLSLSRLSALLIRATLTCVFATVGVLLGALAGALIGVATASGVVRGSISGAISGALSSVEVVEDSLAIWRNNGSGQWSILYLLCALSAPFLEVLDDIFEAGGGGTKGMPKASVDKLPKINIHVEDCVDARSESISCAVCLQEFQAGEAARTLPQCQHIFHLPCIDSWLIRHGSCPLCRHNFSEAYLVQ